MGDISSLQSAVWITPDLTVNLNKALDGDKNLNSHIELTAEVKKELMIAKKKLQ